MSQQVHDKIARGEARIVDVPANDTGHRVKVDRSFGLLPVLYAATVAGYLGFLAIVGAAFMNPVLVIPMALFVLSIVAGFGVPTIFTRLKGNDSKPLTYGSFAKDGIMTNTGRLAAKDATIQVLMLPVLIVAWGIAVVTVAAFVG